VTRDADLREAGNFVAEFIGTAEQLEVLLLLHAEPGRGFTASEVSQRVYTVPAAALLRLDELATAGLLSSDGAADPRFRYAPASGTLDRRVDTLARAYRADRVAVVRLIYGRPRDPMQSLADAFRIRRTEG
jgi:hypothetical protein